jgi:hypothetical protein
VQGGARDRTGAYTAVREDANPKRQRSNRPLSTDQGMIYMNKGGTYRRGVSSLWKGRRETKWYAQNSELPFSFPV